MKKTDELIEDVVRHYEMMDYTTMVKKFNLIPKKEVDKVNEYLGKRYSKYFMNKFGETLCRYVNKFNGVEGK